VFKGFEMIIGRYPQVVKIHCGVKHEELAVHDAHEILWKTS
jgi:hypothetical protein